LPIHLRHAIWTMPVGGTRAPTVTAEPDRRRRRMGLAERQITVPGLRPFDLGEHRVFFGRNREITQIAELLRSPERAERASLTVVGASGCGKSSLIRAGLVPRIAGEDYWLPVPPIMPGTDRLAEPRDRSVVLIAALAAA
jgi:hypothetical protein